QKLGRPMGPPPAHRVFARAHHELSWREPVALSTDCAQILQFSGAAFEYITEIRPAPARSSRVLKPGGRQDMSYQLEHRTTKTVTKGTHYPLGATLTPTGVNFAIYSQHATDVFLLLFDKIDGDPTDIIHLDERDKFVSHAHVKGVKPGQLYGYKVR